MAQTYKKQDILNVLKGATFLGAGGGGSFIYGKRLLDKLEELQYDIQFELLSLDEMEDTKHAGMVAALGQPTAIDPTSLSEDLPAAFTALKIACQADGNDLAYLYSGEMGGFNTMVPIFLSIVSDKDPAKRIPVLDVDANGRAVPELGTCLASARGIEPSPLGMAGHKSGQAQYRYISWPEDATAAEAMARKLGGGWYDLIGFSTWAMSKNELQSNAGVNYISYARRIGEALGNTQMPLFDALHSVIPQLKELFNGTIEEIRSDGGGGFDRGMVIIKDRAGGNDRIAIRFQNESLYVGKFENDEITEVYLTVPELTSLVDADTREPLTNDNTQDIRVGQNVTVFLSPAHYYWWDGKEAYSCFRHVLDDAGYTGEFVRYSPFFEGNKGKTSPMRLQLAFVSEDASLEDQLLQYLRQNIYSTADYNEELVAQAFYDPDAPTTGDPTVTEKDIVINSSRMLPLAAQRYADANCSAPWAGHFISRIGDDKTLRAIREASSRPSFDAFEPAMLLSLGLADRIGVLTWPETMVPLLVRKIASAGLSERIVSVRAVADEGIGLKQALVLAAKQIIDDENVQAIIIGRSFWGKNEDYTLAEQVYQALQADPQYAVPVLDPNKTAIRWLEMCIHMGYFHSRHTYLTPPAKNV